MTQKIVGLIIVMGIFFAINITLFLIDAWRYRSWPFNKEDKK